MRITVIKFDANQTKKIKEGLKRLTQGVDEMARDMKDQRVDLSDMESFIDALRGAADYFEKAMDDSTADDEMVEE